MAINRNKPATTPTKPETTKPEAAKPVAAPPVTFDVNDPALKAMLAQAVAVALAAQKAELMAAMPAKPAKMSIAGKSEASIKNEIQTVRAFKRIGISDAKPHVNIFTFNKWASQGFRPVEGSKSVKVANLRLFHVSQVRKLTAEERKTLQQQSADAVARHEQASKPASTTKGKVVPISEAHPQ
jgi:hypothetical protein